ncbi:DUF1206 domain-containing protein [Telluribacter humicola]|uniref:DUF1206 domain-containing protein n=1 Tax=Telluribacter humicola TaxID=1720261 RepID=UPI001A97D16E|nr:DUF1206 domain-containing protein [Telluribacter humicola]
MEDIASYIPDVPKKWVVRIAQIGLNAKGIVYCLTGILAFIAAFKQGSVSQQVGRKDIFLFIEELFRGKVLLGLLAIGLACYSAWRLLQAIKDTEKRGACIKGVVYRMRYAASGMFYGLLTFLAAKLAIGTSSGNLSFRRVFTNALLKLPFGHLIVIMLAGVIALAGIYLIYQALSGKYQKKIKETGWKDKAEDTMIRAGKIGYIARGLVWIIISYMILKAGLNTTSGKAENAFQFLESSSYGSFLLAGVALGFICYSLFVFMEARFRDSKS